MSRDLPPAIFIMGPTASGKTDLAVALARELPVDVISVDSALVYRGMDIGTAKPEPALLAEVPHALQYGLSELPASDPQLREQLHRQLQELGSRPLHQRLARLDPLAASRIHPNDPQRLIRALEVIEQTGVPFSRLQAQHRGSPLPWRVLKLVRAPQERSLLHRRIEQRFHAMLASGFEEEVERLLARPGMHPGLPSLRAVGYRQMVEYLQGKWDRETMVERGIVATRQLAKRQFTWLRRETGANWLGDGPRVAEQALRLLEKFIHP